MKIAILGATGSIGEQTLDVLRDGSHDVVALSAHSDRPKLEAQIAEFRPARVALTGDSSAPEKIGGVPCGAGPDALMELLDATEPDLVMNAITGGAGLAVTFHALENGIDLAIANKESLVMGGEILVDLARRTGARLLPVDSEHSAVFQCLRCGSIDEVRRIILTASGGPFRGRGRDELADVAPEAALRHPTWRMGPKISIDSATLMNKALEIVEARFLFGLDESAIDVVVHPESVVHSMVEYYDGSIIAHLGATDMRIPIQYALSHPQRWQRPRDGFSLVELQSLHFEAPDHETFPSLTMAREVCARGGTAPAAFNAANERAVQLFLEERIPFLGIFDTVRRAIEAHREEPVEGLEQLLAVDEQTRSRIDAWK